MPRAPGSSYMGDFFFTIDLGGSLQNLFLLACDRGTNANPKHNGRAPPGPGRCVEISVGDAIASQKEKILKRSAWIKGKNKYFEISSRIEKLGWESPSRFPCGCFKRSASAWGRA